MFLKLCHIYNSTTRSKLCFPACFCFCSSLSLSRSCNPPIFCHGPSFYIVEKEVAPTIFCRLLHTFSLLKSYFCFSSILLGSRRGRNHSSSILICFCSSICRLLCTNCIIFFHFFYAIYFT